MQAQKPSKRIGRAPSMQQVKQDAAGLQLSLTGVRCDVVE